MTRFHAREAILSPLLGAEELLHSALQPCLPPIKLNQCERGMDILPGAKDSCFLGGIVNDYEVIKKGEINKKLYYTDKKIWEGREENLVICTWLRQSLVIRPSTNQRSDDSGRRAQPGTSVWLTFHFLIHSTRYTPRIFFMKIFLFVVWGTVLSAWDCCQISPHDLMAHHQLVLLYLPELQNLNPISFEPP